MNRVLLTLLTAFAPLVAADHLLVDPTTSTITFHGITTWHDFDGTAQVREGALLLDGANSAGMVVVAVTSMATGKEGRDAEMHGAVMNAATHPDIRFELRSFTPHPGGGEATGTWTMHGVTLPIAMNVELSNDRAVARFSLDITRWGITPPSIVVNRMRPDVPVVVTLTVKPAPAGHPRPVRATTP